MTRSRFISLLLPAFFAVPLHAFEESVQGYSLAQTSWGDAIKGLGDGKFDPAGFKGKIVIVEEFGVKTPACLVRLRELAKLDKKLRRNKTPAVIIAIHRQRDVPDEKIVEAVKKNRVEFAVRKNGFLSASIGGMPHAAIFLPDGSLFWHGDPTERSFDRKVREAIKLPAAPSASPDDPESSQ